MRPSPMPVYVSSPCSPCATATAKAPGFSSSAGLLKAGVLGSLLMASSAPLHAATQNPFFAESLSQPYALSATVNAQTQAQAQTVEREAIAASAKQREGKCGEGQCGSAQHGKNSEQGKHGEGSCGAGSDDCEEPDTYSGEQENKVCEGLCGEGKFGEGYCGH